jgi:hypothetical protein
LEERGFLGTAPGMGGLRHAVEMILSVGICRYADLIVHQAALAKQSRE